MDEIEQDIERSLRRFRPQAPAPLPVPRRAIPWSAGLAAAAAMALLYWAWPSPPKADGGAAAPAAATAVSRRSAEPTASIAPAGVELRRRSGITGRVVVADEDVPPPKKIADVRPIYPEAARANGVRGIVLLQVIVGPDGSVGDIQVLKSVAALDEAAIMAVSQWKYVPTILNGEPVSVLMRVAVNFTTE